MNKCHVGISIVIIFLLKAPILRITNGTLVYVIYLKYFMCIYIYMYVYLNLRNRLVKCYIWSMALYGAETWTLQAVDQKHLESFEIWCWRRIEKISWIDHVSNEEVLLRVPLRMSPYLVMVGVPLKRTHPSRDRPKGTSQATL
jgi:hypothetical protein